MTQYGKLAQAAGYELELKVLKSRAGYYIGTSKDYQPISRESESYWKTPEEAEHALKTGKWTQRSGY